MTADAPAHLGAAPHGAPALNCCSYHSKLPGPDQALAYVRDTVELRTPIERSLAGEVLRLRAVVEELSDALAEHVGALDEVQGAYELLLAKAG